MGHPTMQENDTAKLTPTHLVHYFRKYNLKYRFKIYLIVSNFINTENFFYFLLSL